VVTPEYVTSGQYEVDIAGIRYPAKVNLHSPNLPTQYPDKERLAYRATRDSVVSPRGNWMGKAVSKFVWSNFEVSPWGLVVVLLWCRQWLLRCVGRDMERGGIIGISSGAAEGMRNNLIMLGDTLVRLTNYEARVLPAWLVSSCTRAWLRLLSVWTDICTWNWDSSLIWCFIYTRL